VLQEIREGGLGALDLGGKHSLFPDIGVKKQPWLRQEKGESIQTAQGYGGSIEQVPKRTVEVKRRLGRERSGDERARLFPWGGDGKKMTGKPAKHD
jgi:hypothetical protein